MDWIRVFVLLAILGSTVAQFRAFPGGRKASEDFDCPEDFGYYPHPEDCSKYYVCVFGGALEELCSSGLVYSDELLTCDWPRNVQTCDPVTNTPRPRVSGSRSSKSPPRGSLTARTVSSTLPASQRSRTASSRATTRRRRPASVSRPAARTAVVRNDLDEVPSPVSRTRGRVTTPRSRLSSVDQRVRLLDDIDDRPSTTSSIFREDDNRILARRQQRLYSPNSSSGRGGYQQPAVQRLEPNDLRVKPTEPPVPLPTVASFSFGESGGTRRPPSTFVHSTRNTFLPPSTTTTRTVTAVTPGDKEPAYVAFFNDTLYDVYYVYDDDELLYDDDVAGGEEEGEGTTASSTDATTASTLPVPSSGENKTPTTPSPIRRTKTRTRPDRKTIRKTRKRLITRERVSRTTKPADRSTTTEKPSRLPSRRPASRLRPTVRRRVTTPPPAETTTAGTTTSTTEAPPLRRLSALRTSSSTASSPLRRIARPSYSTEPDVSKKEGADLSPRRGSTTLGSSFASETTSPQDTTSTGPTEEEQETPAVTKERPAFRGASRSTFANNSRRPTFPSTSNSTPSSRGSSRGPAITRPSRLPAPSTETSAKVSRGSARSTFVTDASRGAEAVGASRGAAGRQGVAKRPRLVRPSLQSSQITTSSRVTPDVPDSGLKSIDTGSTRRGRIVFPQKTQNSVDTTKSSPKYNIWKHPPKRPEPMYSQPAADVEAERCDARCKLPDCSCGGTATPGGFTTENTPQMVLLTFDDSVNDLNKEIYQEMFEEGRKNPNGCPIMATFYVSHEWTDYQQVQNLYAKGHEIASHTISHSFGEQFSVSKWQAEVGGQREIIAAYGGVRLDDIRGMRAPFLSVGGNRMFKMLYDQNFTYDSSLPVYDNDPPIWPYTLDYHIPHDCMIPPCPNKAYPGVWEMPMVMWQDLNGGRCSMVDACTTPPTAEQVLEMLTKNFQRHYTSNRAIFPLYFHAAWFNTPHHREGFMAFLDTLSKMDDVWLVTNWQAIQWMRDPQSLSTVKDFKPFGCDYPERPPPCTKARKCSLWHKSGVRYMTTCQPCPEKYPWTGATGVKKP